MTRWRRLRAPALSVAVMLPVLLGLGIWQVQRLAWKTALLARIDAADAQPGVALHDAPPPFTKIRVEARPRPGSAGTYGAEVRDTPGGAVLGSQVVALLDRAGGAPPIVTVLGWKPAPAPLSLPAEAGTFEGYARAPDAAGWFSPADDPAKRAFYTLDPAAIGPALGAAHVAPFALVVLGQPSPGIYPAPATSMPRPPNDHLGYAVTWFGLAAVLVVVFLLHARKVFRE